MHRRHYVSNFIMYFIILTTAATLHADGQTQISTAREAAEALRPLAGSCAYAADGSDRKLATPSERTKESLGQ